MKSFRHNQVAGLRADLRDSVRTVFYVGVTNFWTLVSGFESASRSLRPILVPARSRRRGAGMLEYALIAALAVGVFLLLRGFFTDLFKSLTGDIEKKLDTPISVPSGSSNNGG